MRIRLKRSMRAAHFDPVLFNWKQSILRNEYVYQEREKEEKEEEQQQQNLYVDIPCV